MSNLRKIVVTGATGKQGGALIAALLARSPATFEIYAVTRNATSNSAQRLASKPNVKVIQGDFKAPKAIFDQIEKPWGVFSVTMPMNAKVEEQQGKAMTKAAIEAGVQHVVFTATDRGAQTETNPTPIPHFASKFNIEKDIIEQSRKSGTTWTFLQPVAFMDNVSNDFFGKVFTAAWRLNGNDSKLQLIGTSDIGKVAAEAFLKAETEQYKNRSIQLAGDEISVQEAAKIFKQETGLEIVETYGFVGRIMKWLLHEQLGIMFNWFKSTGFAANVPELRKEYPFLKDFRQWLREDSAWKKA